MCSDLPTRWTIAAGCVCRNIAISVQDKTIALSVTPSWCWQDQCIHRWMQKYTLHTVLNDHWYKRFWFSCRVYIQSIKEQPRLEKPWKTSGPEQSLMKWLGVPEESSEGVGSEKTRKLKMFTFGNVKAFHCKFYPCLSTWSWWLRDVSSGCALLSWGVYPSQLHLI